MDCNRKATTMRLVSWRRNATLIDVVSSLTSHSKCLLKETAVKRSFLRLSHSFSPHFEAKNPFWFVFFSYSCIVDLSAYQPNTNGKSFRSINIFILFSVALKKYSIWQLEFVWIRLCKTDHLSLKKLIYFPYVLLFKDLYIYCIMTVITSPV